MELKSFALLAELDGRDLEALAEVLEEETLAAGRCLFREGEAASALYLVAEGRVELASRRSPRRLLLGPGASLGGAALLGVGAREATVTALTEARLLRLERTSLRALADEAPRTAYRLLEALAGELAARARALLDR
jgi:voltage-gated potassium channel